MEAVKKAKGRMSQLPGLLIDCKAQATLYGNCVIRCEDVKRNECQREFNELLECVRISAAKRKTRFI